MRPMLLCVSLLLTGERAAAQGPRYPVVPVPLADSIEIALALTAAPRELTDSADVFVVSAGVIRHVKRGTTGAGCTVARDLHEGSLYPICFNAEAARTAMQRELMEVRLRSVGVSEDSIKRAVATAYKDGTLRLPGRMALAYMMSPRQVLFSSPDADGVRVGAWHPHIMIYTPEETGRDLGFARAGSMAGVFQVPSARSERGEFIVVVPRWADGTPRTP
ncbi:MAG: hypothetical protein H7066_01615 [Cytophagaceae bacterium]|nr:hypothetical protein [Gemmatimonadaceae bacterium]